MNTEHPRHRNGVERRVEHERIARRAYELYEARQRQAGHAEEDWLLAEMDLRTGPGFTEEDRISAESARNEAERLRRLAEDAREVRDHHRESLELVRREQEWLRNVGERARAAAEEARAAGEAARQAVVDAVGATAAALRANLEQMQVVEDMRRALRDLRAPLGVVTVMGNHDRYTGEQAVIRGCRDAGQVVVKNGCHVLERGGATLALLGIDDPRSWTADDPQAHDVDAALRAAPSGAFKILLAHRPGAWDTAAPRGIPLTLAGHIHGGQLYVPLLGWSAGRLITKYVMGHFQRGNSQLYVSRGIGVVGVPIRVFTPPELALFELRRAGAA